MLRAYKCRRTNLFDEFHDLHKLYAESGIAGIAGARQEELARALVQSVAAKWSNGFRFRAQEQLRKAFKKIPAYRRVKGDVMKELARQIHRDSLQFVRMGADLWTTSRCD